MCGRMENRELPHTTISFTCTTTEKPVLVHAARGLTCTATKKLVLVHAALSFTCTTTEKTVLVHTMIGFTCTRTKNHELTHAVYIKSFPSCFGIPTRKLICIASRSAPWLISTCPSRLRYKSISVLSQPYGSRIKRCKSCMDKANASS